MAEGGNTKAVPPKYYARIKWRDFVRSMTKLETAEFFTAEQDADVFFHGCTSICFGEEVIDKVSGIDVVVENLQSQFLKKSRFFDKTIALLCRILGNEDQRTALKVRELAFDTVLQFFESDSVMKIPFGKISFYFSTLPVLHDILKAPWFNSKLKLKACSLIEALEEYERGLLGSLSREELIFKHIRELTNNQQKRVLLVGRVDAIKRASDGAVNLDVVVRTLGDSATFDVLDPALALAYFTKERTESIIQSCLRVSGKWKGMLLAKLLEFSAAYSAENLAGISEYIESTFAALLAQLEEVCKTEAGLSQRASLILNILANALEKDLDVVKVTSEIIPKYIRFSSKFPNEQDVVLDYALRFALAAVNNLRAEKLMSNSFDAICASPSCFMGFRIQQERAFLAILLELGSLFADQNIEPDPCSDFFRTQLPKSFFELSQWELTDAQKETLLLRLLTLGHEAITRGMNRFKAFVFYLPSIYTRLTQKLDFSGAQQMDLLMQIVDVCISEMKKGHDISILLSDGIPTALDVFSSFPQLQKVLATMPDKFETSSNFSVLFNVGFIYTFLKSNFSLEEANFFVGNLIEKGQRALVRLTAQVCVQELCSPQYKTVRQLLFCSTALSSREFSGLCEMLAMVIGLNTKHPHKVISAITAQVMRQVEDDIQKTGSLDKALIQTYHQKISRISLFSALFRNELDSMSNVPEGEIIAIFEAKFPAEVLMHKETMDALALIGKRLEHMNDKYKHVKQQVIEVLNVFLSGDAPTEGDQIRFRTEQLNRFLHAHPRNVAIREHLIQVGYRPELWDRDLFMKMKIKEIRNAHENFRSAIVASYQEYSDMLKGLGVSKITVDGQEKFVANLFLPQATLDDLKKQRNAAEAEILQHIAEHHRKAFYESRLQSLQEKEQQLLQSLQQESAKEPTSSKFRSYWVRFNNTFFRTASTSSNQIVGCYAPDGDHCEKPLEIGMKANAAMISIFEESKEKGKEGTIGAEIENVEVLFTDQGMLVYQLYTNGHPFDTSLLWISTFQALLQDNFVPTIILPKGLPNVRTFSVINTFVPEEYSTSLLSYRDDFFDTDVVSYYDFKPEKIKEGDILLTPENASLIELKGIQLDEDSTLGQASSQLKTSAEISTLLKPFVPPPIQRDWHGTLVSRVMDCLEKHPAYAQLEVKPNILGKLLAEYVKFYLQHGEYDVSILSVGFDLEQWNRRKSKKGHIDGEKKQELINVLMSEVQRQVSEYYDMDPDNLYAANSNHFFEMKDHLEKTGRKDPKKRQIVDRMREFLQRHTSLLMINDADRNFRETLIQKIFNNEERVWQERGGRPADETLQLFLNFTLPPHLWKEIPEVKDYDRNHFGHEPMGGLVLFNQLSATQQPKRSALPAEMVAYLVGDFSAKDTYEVVTAFVDPRYRGMNISIQMYVRMMLESRERGCRWMLFDTISGGVGKVIASNPVFAFLTSWGIDKIIVQKKKFSYSTTTSAGIQEDFEQAAVDLRYLVPPLKLYFYWKGIDWKRYPFQPAPKRVSSKMIVAGMGAACIVLSLAVSLVRKWKQ